MQYYINGVTIDADKEEEAHIVADELKKEEQNIINLYIKYHINKTK
jgi:hypothetical protein